MYLMEKFKSRLYIVCGRFTSFLDTTVKETLLLTNHFQCYSLLLYRYKCASRVQMFKRFVPNDGTALGSINTVRTSNVISPYHENMV